jgi:hypothetical protein
LSVPPVQLKREVFPLKSIDPAVTMPPDKLNTVPGVSHTFRALLTVIVPPET